MRENNGDIKSFVEGVFSAEENSAATLGDKKLKKYNSIAVRMFHTGVLTPREMLFPAIAELANQILAAVNAYRTLYFVNVLKIDMAYITVILMLIGIYDVLNNPLMGAAYDHTRTRWGKARPYIILTAAPYFISTAVLYSGAMFLGNRPGNDPSKIIFVFVMLFIMETFSTIYSLPRGNMLSLQTVNPKDRITVGLLQNYIGSIGSSVIFALFMPIMELNNKGYINFPAPLLFFSMATFASAVGIVGNISMALNCKERILLQPKPAPLRKTLFYILKNKYALRNFLAGFSTSWWSSGGYSWDVVTQQEIFGGSIPSMISYLPYNVLNPVSVAFIPKFQKFFKNNKTALITLRFWDLFAALGMAVAGWFFVEKRLIVCIIFAVFHGLNALNNGPANVFEAEVAREINDYTEYVTGERPDGTFGLLTELIGKVTAPLNSMLTIMLFKWSGYDSTIPMLPWSQGSKLVYQKVWFLFTGISIIPTLVHIIPYFFYDLVGEKREQMYIALNERRAMLAEEDQFAALNEVMSSLEEGAASKNRS